MRRVMAVFMALAACVCVLAACGGGNPLCGEIKQLCDEVRTELDGLEEQLERLEPEDEKNMRPMWKTLDDAFGVVEEQVTDRQLAGLSDEELEQLRSYLQTTKEMISEMRETLKELEQDQFHML